MSKSKSRIFCSGYESNLDYLFRSRDPNKTNLPYWTLITKIKKQKEIKKILLNGFYCMSGDYYDSNTDFNFLVWRGNSSLKLYCDAESLHSEKTKREQFRIQNEKIVDIFAGGETFLILTKSGNVYSLADFNYCVSCEIPLPDPEKSYFEKIRSIPFFNDEENNRKVKSIATTQESNYFLCKDGQLGNGNTKNRWAPILIHENAKRIFGGMGAFHFFFITESNELFACGKNTNGQLSIGNNISQLIPQRVDNWNGNDILDIHCFKAHSVLITTDGKTFSCGSRPWNGTGLNKAFFTQIEAVKNKKMIKVAGQIDITLLLTSGNELYGWGFIKDNLYFNHPTNQYQNERERWIMPRKINLPQIYQNKSIALEISCGIRSILLYPKHINSLREDFKILFKSKKFCDSKLTLSNKEANKEKNEKKKIISIPIHKLIIELRTNLKINEIQKIFNENQFTEKQINIFLKWAYSGTLNDKNEIIVKKIFHSLNLSFPPQNSLKKDLLKLYNDNNSKDFSILVKKKRRKRGKGNGNGNEDYDKVFVHKLILLIRSGLFRDMFESLNEKEKEIKQIKDYTRKSKQSMEILIKYFYTNKINLEVDTDYKTIKRELKDSIKYYQLNEKSAFDLKLRELDKN
ncbi:btk-binding protein-related [Anaeramoeba flamelloides]|uniref:Btk-binding protein-related n=1 Tax=Anaeramoeba flamelloides TaxID=1746091 RepID=A0ABQ8XAD8_9EUKA|nr:btk-binding protein-related [Anaeramoeba flamelloides]